MARILIATISDDMHAAAVAHVLERMGHEPVRWVCADFPQRGTISLSPHDPEGASPRVADARGELPAAPADVFWNRRPSLPVIGPGVLPEGDRRFALRESAILLTGAIDLLSQGGFAVNGPREAARAENKVVQLSVARALGFALPDTLISNEPERIRRFVRERADVGAIYKPFRPATWESADRLAMLYTAKVDEASLPDDDLLRLGPGIFQAYVPKAYELRVTCMGDEVLAARLDSQATRDGKVDWRIAHVHDLAVRPVELPPAVARRCLELLRRLGLVFGCIDLIVTPEGEYVFLEVNQMGQFLWVEIACPAMPMLQTFCEFLVRRDPHFRRAPGAPVVHTFAGVRAAASATLEAERGRHARPEQESHVMPE
ncbi:MAG TPA: hypothetical protein VFS43_41570 [Polyangiaceae bacterium]|nr:hypothetical protein [Polyangiaceae bacterium]